MEAAIDGAVAMGLPRVEAQKMAAQTMVLEGEHPALLQDKPLPLEFALLQGCSY